MKPDNNEPENTREVIQRLFDRNNGRLLETVCTLLRELTVFSLNWQNQHTTRPVEPQARSSTCN